MFNASYVLYVGLEADKVQAEGQLRWDMLSQP